MFPIRDTIRHHRFPLGTTLLIALNVYIFYREVTLPQESAEYLIRKFALVPTRFLHSIGTGSNLFSVDPYVPLFSSIFLHGSILHVVSNMWALWIFGDNVEDRMGLVRYLFFYTLCGVAAGIAHIFINNTSTLPTIGASGAVAGIMGAYMFMYPRSSVVILVPIILWPLFFQVPAFLFIALWFWAQISSGMTSLSSATMAGGIAWWGHIGGFVWGVLTFPFFIQERFKRTPSGRVGTSL